MSTNKTKKQEQVSFRDTESSLLDGQDVRAGDGVTVEEGEELAEGVEEGPVGEQADALVGVDGAWGRRAGRGAGGRCGGGCSGGGALEGVRA